MKYVIDKVIKKEETWDYLWEKVKNNAKIILIAYNTKTSNLNNR